MKKCLVLGGGGFIGKNLCPELAKQYYVISYDRYYCNELRNNDNIKQIIGNFVEDKSFLSILKDIDIVYHLIGTTLPSDDIDKIVDEAVENIIPTLRLLSDMVMAGVDKIIFISSGGTVYGERKGHICKETDKLKPQCTYAVQKQVIEDYLDFFDRCTDLKCFVARLANPYGIGQDIHRKQGVIPIFVHNIIAGLPITVVGNGTDKRDYIDMSDVVAALVKLGSYSGNERTFNIGSGKSYSILEIIRIIECLSQKKFVQINYIPERRFDVTDVSLNIDMTKKELNWWPKKELKIGIEEIIEIYKSYL